jgi:hypothetical protein
MSCCGTESPLDLAVLRLLHRLPRCGASPVAIRKCAFGHRHPPLRVVSLLEDVRLTGRKGQTYFHCADCPQLAAGAGWQREEYSSPKAARKAGRTRACEMCFPRPTVVPMLTRTEVWSVSCLCGWSAMGSQLQASRRAGRRHVMGQPQIRHHVHVERIEPRLRHSPRRISPT